MTDYSDWRVALMIENAVLEAIMEKVAYTVIARFAGEWLRGTDHGFVAF